MIICRKIVNSLEIRLVCWYAESLFVEMFFIPVPIIHSIFAGEELATETQNNTYSMKTLRKTLLLLCTLASSFGLSAQTVSSGDGSFTLEGTSENQIVKISSIGYKTAYKLTAPANIGVVRLVSDAQILGEVVVKGDLPKMHLKGDAMVTTVQGSILEKAGTGEDLLDKLPGVSADDGEVRVFGAGTPEIYINGRKVRDNSGLDQLSSDNINSVEVVNIV